MALVSREEGVDATCCRGWREPDHDSSISPRCTRVNHPRNIAVLMDFSAGHHAFGKKPLRVLLFDQQRLLKIDRARIRKRTGQAMRGHVSQVLVVARNFNVPIRPSSAIMFSTTSIGNTIRSATPPNCQRGQFQRSLAPIYPVKWRAGRAIETGKLLHPRLERGD